MLQRHWLIFGPLLGLSVASCSSPAAPGPGTAGGSSGGNGGGAPTTGGATTSAGGTTVTSGGMGGAPPSTGGASLGGNGAGGSTVTNGGSTTGGAAQTSGGALQTGGGGGLTTTGGSASTSGGASATGGAAGSTTGGSGGATQTNCTFTVKGSISKNIPTVGTVEWSTTLANVDSAQIDFGLDTNYGLTAPVDLKAASYKTPLLGMKPSKTYHYRVVAKSGAMQCASSDNTFMTGALANNLPKVTINTPSASALARGYLVTGTYQTGPAYIMDGDGDFVWWYGTGEVTRAHMSYDGKYMWIGKGNVPQGTAKMVRVSMDGSEVQDLSSQFKDLNHDFTILPDETIIFIAYDNGCDKIVERSPSGTTRDIINIGKAEGGGASMCHANAIHYSKEDDSVIVSDLDQDNYVKVTRQGQVTWILGGTRSTFKGEGATWDNQHGFQILATDRLLIFNNGPMGAGAGSLAIEIKLDLTAKTATRAWSYAAQPAISVNVMGDVQRLDNGNTLITYSTQGVIHEVDASGKLLQSMTFGIGDALGYSTKRKSLYGPPPR